MPAADLLRRLEKIPTEPHLLADYVELRCLISRDGEYTMGDLSAAIVRQRDIGRTGSSGVAAALQTATEADADTSALITSADFDVGATADEGDQAARERIAGTDPETDPPEDPVDARATETSASAEHGDLLALLERRATVFNRHYPFELDDGLLRLRSPLTPGQCLYLFLLVASCHRNIRQGSDRAALTAAFERLAAPVLRKYFGERMEAHVFGTATKKGDRYPSNLKKAVKKLSKDTGFARTKKWKRHQREISASGDRGLDVVGWIPFHGADPADLQFVVFGQCATGKNWLKKQFDASRQRWERVLHMSGPVTHVLLISFSWRGIDGDWHKTLELVTSNVIFDRDRIVPLMNDDSFDDLPSDLLSRLIALDDADDL